MAEALGSALASVAPSKPKASALDEWERQRLAREAAAAPTAFQAQYASAADRLASTAAGNASPALLAAQQSSREALARQAGNLRSSTAQGIAASGQLGQGAGVRAGMAVENTIGQQLADSRLKERQAIGQEATQANSDLISGAQADRQFGLQQAQAQRGVLGDLLQSGSAAQKLQAQTGLQGLAGITPGANTDAINEQAYQEAINDPKYQQDQETARLGLAEAKAKSATALPALELEVQYAPYVAKANALGRTFSDFKTSVRNGFQTDAKVGDLVMVDGRPLKYEGQSIASDSFNPILGLFGAQGDKMRQFTFSDPITGAIVKKIERPS